MLTRRPRLLRALALLLALAVLLTACNQGMPEQAGQYEIKPDSLSWDGQQYEFTWVGSGGELNRARGDDVRLVQDERTYLEMRDGRPIVHLKADDSVTVLGRDRDGDFSSSWFPFLAGAALGNVLGGRDRTVVIQEPAPGTARVPPDRPAYRYPPTDSFGRGDTLHGTVTNDRPAAPDYKKVRPVPDAVSGQSGGTGGGTAASNRAPSVSSGQAGGAGSGAAASTKGKEAVSGQAGGTGAGSAASSKGTFRAGESAPAGSSGGSKVSPSGGLKPPAAGSSGAKSSGGFSGGKSSGAKLGGGIGKGRR